MRLAVYVFLLFLIGCNKPTEVGKYSLGQCLTEKGVIMYGAEWCGYCKNQKEAFGDDFKNVVYIECTEQEELCEQSGITTFPTWIINGEKHTGSMPLQELASLAGC